MRRVLLVIEDYNELLFTEKILKKVGFDVETLHSEAPLADKIIGFFPDLVVATGNGVRVDGMSVAKKVKRKGATQKLLLLFNPDRGAKKTDYASYGADGFLEAPVNPRILLKTVCDITGIPSEPIISKFDKLVDNTEEEHMQVVSKKGRAEVYARLLKSVPESKVVKFDHQAVENERRFQKKTPDSPEELKIDEEKKTFVTKLYKGWKR